VSAEDDEELRIVGESSVPFEVHLTDTRGDDEDLSLATRATFSIRADPSVTPDLLLRTTLAGDLVIDSAEAILRCDPPDAAELLLLPEGLYIGQGAVEVGGVWLHLDPVRVRILRSFATVLP
jgi:hypothetical protein